MKAECPKWQKVLAANSGKMPESHVNAYSKARDTWNKANGVVPRPRLKTAQKGTKFGAKQKVSALLRYEDNDSEFSSDDSEADYAQVPIQALRIPCAAVRIAPPDFTHDNKFSALDDGMAFSEDVVDALNHWAHTVNVKTLRPKKLKKAETRNDRDLNAALAESKRLRSREDAAALRPKFDVVIRNDKDLDAALAENKWLRSRMPGDGDIARLATAMSKAPPADQLQPGEVWGLVDSGSGVDGMDTDLLCPGVELEEAEHPVTCITANGEEMEVNQVATLKVALDGQASDIPFSKLPLTMPIISVRKHCARGHRCRLNENSGYFRNVQTRQKTRFVVKDGVYFVRLHIATDLSKTCEPCQPPEPRFIRPDVK